MIDSLILTSCVYPPEQKLLKLNDGKERYKQTLNSILFYIGCGLFRRIIVCDGSGCDFGSENLPTFSKKHDVQLEILYFKQDFFKVSEYGKGYGEGEIMNYVISNSNLLRNCFNFVKITGRLCVENIDTIVSGVKDKNYIYFNIIPSKKIGCVDTRVYIMPKETYRNYFLDAYKRVNDGIGNTYEYCFTDVIKANKLKIHSIPQVPILVGYSGTENKQYGKDLEYKTKVLLKKVGLMNTMFAAYILLVIHAFKVIMKKT